MTVKAKRLSQLWSEQESVMQSNVKVTPLSDLSDGATAVIAAVDGSVEQLMELGFVPGVRITPTYSGPGGELRVYELEGTLVALRRSAAHHISVSLTSQDTGGEMSCSTECLCHPVEVGTPVGATVLRTVAVVGPPNSGKTTLPNRLTGLRQKVANYPGVTVEQHSGRIATERDG